MPFTTPLASVALLIAGSALAAAPVDARSAAPSFSQIPTAVQLSLREVEPQPFNDELLRPTAPSVRLASTVAMAPSQRVSRVIEGTASWYGPGFFGNRTANGEVYRPGTLTAAHRSLPFGTMVRVTNLNNGRTAVVRINDRGPFVGSRVIDLGHGAAQQVGLVSSGTAPVRLEVLR
jgi:rare lipoprotein A